MGLTPVGSGACGVGRCTSSGNPATATTLVGLPVDSDAYHDTPSSNSFKPARRRYVASDGGWASGWDHIIALIGLAVLILQAVWFYGWALALRGFW